MKKHRRIINWFFWEGDKPFSVDIDQIEVVAHNGFSTLDSEYDCTEEASAALRSEIQEYALWLAAKDATPTPPPVTPPPAYIPDQPR